MPRSLRHPLGEYINLDWGWERPDWYAVRGHVTPEEYARAMDDYHGESGWAAEYTDGAPRQTWARWQPANDGDHAQACRERGRGCFAVTVADAASTPLARRAALG